jgi:hypothetical protein
MIRFLLLLMLVVQCSAATAHLEWNANTEDDLAGYRAYAGKFGQPHSQSFWTVSPKISLSFPAGEYQVVFTAVDFTGNESEPTEPFPIFVLRLTYQETDDLGVWYDLHQYEIIATRPKRFYRLKISNGIP